MRKLTMKEWFKERWWAVLLYFSMAITAIIFSLREISNPIMSWGLFFTIVGICVWLIANDSRLVGKCSNCGKTLVVVDDICRCGKKIE